MTKTVSGSGAFAKRALVLGVLAASLAAAYIAFRSIAASDAQQANTGSQQTLDAPVQAAKAPRTLNGFDLSELSIPFNEIRSGGPPKDGIPAILDPTFVRSDEAEFLSDSDVVIGLTRGSDVRAYPLRILVWHEIVNDVIDGDSIAVTYCPLCGTAMVFDAHVDGRDLTFGVSGLLYNSDVLMYDHQTESLWSQLKMEAVSGEMIGAPLPWVPSWQTTWADWREKHPDTKVLSTDTGFERDYSRHPYTAYEQSPRTMFPVPQHRTELGRKDWVVGVIVDGQAKAYPLSAFENQPEIEDTISDTEIRLRYNAQADHVEVADESGDELPSVRVYWFAWQAFYPETLLHVNEE